MTKLYDPYKNYMTNDSLSSDFILGDTEWKCEMVDPNHPALWRRADIDPFKTDADWEQREKEMIDLMYRRLGMGLAATQIGTSFNMFVMTHSHLGDIGVYNPRILEEEGEVTIEEGCLTWPMLYIKVKRPERIKVRYTKTDGTTDVETWMDGMDARCFLHEKEHLLGINFIDKVGPFALKRAKEKRDKMFKKMSRR